MPTPATIAAVYDGVYTALAALGPSSAGGSGSLACVTDFAGEVTQELIEQATLRRYPAALLALAAEDPSSATVETTTGEMETITRTQLVIYLAALALRGDRQAERGGTNGPKGLFTIASEVLSAVNGLVIDGLWGTGRVHYAGARPTLIKRGAVYVYALRFQADRITEQRDLADPTNTVPLNEIDANVNIYEASAADTAAKPLARGRMP